MFWKLRPKLEIRYVGGYSIKERLSLTFREPCIVIYSYNKSQRDALFLNFYFGKQLYMFRTDLLSIIRSSTTTSLAESQHNWYDKCQLL